MIEVVMLVEVLTAYGCDNHDNEGKDIVNMFNLGKERLQDICFVLPNAGKQGQVKTHLVKIIILVENIFNHETYCVLFNKLLHRGDIPCCNPIGQRCVDDVVLRHVLEHTQDGVHHDAHLFQNLNSIQLLKRACAIIRDPAVASF